MVSEPFIGILMLDTRFERPLGDAGNPASYSIPARIRIVRGADSTCIVKNGKPDAALVDAFRAAAMELERDGACAITSTCGFLISIQDELAKALSIPTMVSALSLYDWVKKQHPNGPVAILTASAKSLGDAALQAAGISKDDVLIAGMEDCSAFADTYLCSKDQQSLILDMAAIEAGLVERAHRLLKDQPLISAFLLECGNMPQHQKAIAKATGKPVYSILDGVERMVRSAPKPN